MNQVINDKVIPFQILSLSGGGVRGLFTITVLAELEQYLADETSIEDYWIGQHFDLITGTSIGGILALTLASGATARDLKEVLNSDRLKIFPPMSGPFKKLRQLYRTIKNGQYSAEPLRHAIESVVNQQIIGELKTRTLIPTINASTGFVQTFKTPHHNNFRRDWREKIVDIALATSAAPTYFPPHQIGKSKFVDGGLAANSPALMALHEARHFLGQETSQIKILSIGTMGGRQTLPEQGNESHGYANWDFGKTLISMSLSSTESLHNQIASHLLNEQILFVDDTNTPEQSKTELSLDNASDEAATIMIARAEHEAKCLVSKDFFRNIVRHKAPEPSFFHGPNKNTVIEDSL